MIYIIQNLTNMAEHDVKDFAAEFPTNPFNIQPGNVYRQVDIDQPATAITGTETFESPMQVAALQSTLNAQLINEATDVLSSLVDNLTVDQQNSIADLKSKSNLIAKKIAKVTEDAFTKQAKMVAPEPHLQIPLPEPGATDNLETSALKMIDVFSGDHKSDSQNAEDLRKTLTSLYQQVRGKVTALGSRRALQKRLSGTAAALCDRFVLSFASEDTGIVPDDQPSLQQFVQFLESRFMCQEQPQLAALKLDTMVRHPGETVQSLEARVSKLCLAASLDIPEQKERLKFIKSKELSSFLRCLSSSDRLLLETEDSQRKSLGLPPYNMTQCAEYLLLHQARKQTYREIKGIANPTKPKQTDDKSDNLSDMMKFTAERGQPRGRRSFRGGRPGSRRGGRGNDRPRQNGPTTEDTNYQFQQRGTRPFRASRGGRFDRQRGGRQWRGRGRGRFQTGNQRQDQQNSNALDPRPCVKCRVPSHSASERARCVYGASRITSQECQTCRRGRHPRADCIGMHNSLGAQRGNSQDNPTPTGQRDPQDQPPQTGGTYNMWKDGINLMQTTPKNVPTPLPLSYW